jgi:antitoxin (DNA-binding transcriptional repressor) of toxin-antitoxin stability system
MIISTVARAKDRLSSLLRRVQAGETLIILDRKTPIARVERIQNGLASPHVLPPRREWNPREILDLPAGPVSPETSLVDAVREERESGW